jgi:hypothetical protein
MPLVVVNFPSRKVSSLSNPSDEWESLLGLAETSRNILELARVYQWARSHHATEVAAAAKKRALQLGFKASQLEGDQRGALRNNLTDRAYRYRAQKAIPEGSARCVFCGTSKKLMVGHLDGHEENTAPDNLAWTCRSCNALHGNALKRARMGRRTAQFNPMKSGGAYNLGEWVNAVGTITAHKYPDQRGSGGALAAASTMTVSDAVAMIRATPASKRSQFAAQLGKRKGGRRRSDDSVPF